MADQKAIRWNADLQSFFVEGRHLNITVLITTQHVKGVGPMVRGNCDLVFLQPIYNRDSRDTLYANYAGFLEKKEFFALMDQVVARQTLDGNCAAEPRKHVRVMVIADYEDTIETSEKLFWWVPVHSDDLPPFKLLDAVYWEEGVVEEVDSEVHISHKKVRDPVDVLDEVAGALGGQTTF